MLAGAAALISQPRPTDLVKPDEVQAYSAFVDEHVRGIAANYAGSACPAATRLTSVGLQKVGPLASLRTPGAEQQWEGDVYKEQVSVEGCGPARTYNLMVVRQKTGGWFGYGMLPGGSAAGPLLQRDTFNMVGAVAITSPPALSCSQDEAMRTGRVVDTVLLDTYVPGGIWHERWIAQVCGIERPVVVTFTPTPADGGTDFSVKPDWRTKP
jgi:hypothetical protein